MQFFNSLLSHFHPIFHLTFFFGHCFNAFLFLYSCLLLLLPLFICLYHCHLFIVISVLSITLFLPILTFITVFLALPDFHTAHLLSHVVFPSFFVYLSLSFFPVYFPVSFHCPNFNLIYLILLVLLFPYFSYLHLPHTLGCHFCAFVFFFLLCPLFYPFRPFIYMYELIIPL